jgi:iron complex outermembrane receptor protein
MRGRIAALVVVILLAPALARADVRTEARRYFRHGMALIQEGEVERGIEMLEQAYDTLPHPNVLYNIARAHAEAGHYEEAIVYFERYLESDPADRAEVRGFIAAIRTRMTAEAAERADAGQPVEPAPAPEPPRQAATEEEILTLEDAATQITALAEATQSDALRQRSERLRALAASLRERNDAAARVPEVVEGATVEGEGAGTPTGEATDPPHGEEDPVDVPQLALGESADEEIYEERVVSASRYAQSPLDAPNATTNITRQDVRLTGVGYMNIGELVRRVPGADVATMTPIDTQLSARGFNQRLSNKMLVLVDGRSVYIDTLGVTLWSTVPFAADDIERIEVIRGPASALYGADAFSGIINILTRPPGPEETTLTVGYGTGDWGIGHVASSGSLDRLGYRLAATYQQADSFTREIDENRLDYERFGSSDVAVRGVLINGSLRYRVSEDVLAQVQAGVSENEQVFQGTGPLRQFRAKGPFLHAMGLVETSWGQLRAFWNYIDALGALDAYPTGGDPLSQPFVSNTVDVEAEFARQLELGVEHNLHVGAGYRLKQITWGYLDEPHTENHYAIFFQDTLGILDPLSLVASFRVDFHPLLESPVFSPRGAMIVRPTDGSAIRGSVGTAFRTPTFLESYLSLPNPTPLAGAFVDARGSEVAGIDLSPESILSAEVGYRNADSELFDVEVSAYYNRVQDLIVLSDIDRFELHDFVGGPAEYDEGVAGFPVGTITFANESATYDVIGGEIGTRLYPVRGLDVYANYALNRTFVSDDADADREEERTSTHKINFGVQYRSTFGLDVAADVHWVSDQVWVEPVFDVSEGVVPGTFPLASYYLVNARVGYRLLDDTLEIAINGFNVTNHRHRQHPYGQLVSARYLATATYRF